MPSFAVPPQLAAYPNILGGRFRVPRSRRRALRAATIVAAGSLFLGVASQGAYADVLPPATTAATPVSSAAMAKAYVDTLLNVPADLPAVFALRQLGEKSTMTTPRADAVRDVFSAILADPRMPKIDELWAAAGRGDASSWLSIQRATSTFAMSEIGLDDVCLIIFAVFELLNEDPTFTCPSVSDVIPDKLQPIITTAMKLVDEVQTRAEKAIADNLGSPGAIAEAAQAAAEEIVAHALVLAQPVQDAAGELVDEGPDAVVEAVEEEVEETREALSKADPLIAELGTLVTMSSTALLEFPVLEYPLYSGVIVPAAVSDELLFNTGHPEDQLPSVALTVPVVANPVEGYDHRGSISLHYDNVIGQPILRYHNDLYWHTKTDPVRVELDFCNHEPWAAGGALLYWTVQAHESQDYYYDKHNIKNGGYQCNGDVTFEFNMFPVGGTLTKSAFANIYGHYTGLAEGNHSTKSGWACDHERGNICRIPPPKSCLQELIDNAPISREAKDALRDFFEQFPNPDVDWC